VPFLLDVLENTRQKTN